MNEQEIRQFIKQLRDQFSAKFKGESEEEIDKRILDMFFEVFCDDKMSRGDLTVLAELMGYEVKEEILDEVEKEKRGDK